MHQPPKPVFIIAPDSDISYTVTVEICRERLIAYRHTVNHILRVDKIIIPVVIVKSPMDELVCRAGTVYFAQVKITVTIGIIHKHFGYRHVFGLCGNCKVYLSVQIEIELITGLVRPIYNAVGLLGISENRHCTG